MSGDYDGVLGDWPGASKTVTFDDLAVEVRVAPNGEVVAEQKPPSDGSRFTIEHEDSTIQCTVGEQTLYLNGSDISIYVPHDDGKIPAVFGRKMVPGWLMKQLRLNGFRYDESDVDDQWVKHD